MSKIGLLTRLEMCKELGIRPETLSRWTSAGIIPGIKIGGRLVRYDADQVREHLIKVNKQKLKNANQESR
jgi:excisionase family DNA binding protein